MRLWLMLIAACLLLAAGCSDVQDPRLLEDSGSISVHFCPAEDCEELLASFIGSAQQSVYCALYDLSLDTIKGRLQEKSQLMPVFLLIDDGNFNHVSSLGFALPANPTGLMHNKFCVADGKKVFTGSFNPTYKGANETFNNAVVIESAHIAANYAEEFRELWNGEFGRGAKVKFPGVNVNGVEVENYFCPEDNCADQLKQEIRNANKSVYFMAFSFTDHSIANELIIKHSEGLEVRGLFDSSQAGSEDSVFELLKYQGIDVAKDKSPFVLHHKVFVIDENTVVTGSYNPTVSGDTRNDENMLVIHDKAIAQMFSEEFSLLEAKT